MKAEVSPAGIACLRAVRSLQGRELLAVMFLLIAANPTVADDAMPDADKSNFTLFDPTSDADLRTFNTDRPPKANSPYTVDAGHFQYETDLAVFSGANAGGVKTHEWTVLDPTLKLGLSNTIDAELQLTPYESVVTRSAAGRSTVSGMGDTVARLKIKRWTIYSEIFTSQYFDSRDPSVYTLDEALTYAISPNLQLDVGGNFSLNKIAPHTQLYTGLSQRL